MNENTKLKYLKLTDSLFEMYVMGWISLEQWEKTANEFRDTYYK